MTSDKLKEAVKAEPFKLFALHLGGGRAVNVMRPELIMIAPSGRTAAIYGPDDALEIIDVFMVQSIEFLKRGTGPTRKRRKAG
jgi:hypothetical protein